MTNQKRTNGLGLGLGAVTHQPDQKKRGRMEISGTLIIHPDEDRAVFLGSLVPMIIAGKPAEIIGGIQKAVESFKRYLDKEGLSFEDYAAGLKEKRALRPSTRARRESKVSVA